MQPPLDNYFIVVGYMTTGLIVFWSVAYGAEWVYLQLTAPKHKVTVHFIKSGKKVSAVLPTSILAVAVKNGISIKTDCLLGTCNKCVAQLKEGSVVYQIEDTRRLKKNFVQVCVTVPAGDISINA